MANTNKNGQKFRKRTYMKTADYCRKIMALYKEHKQRGLSVCDTTLIPDYFDIPADSRRASEIEDIINVLL